MYQQTPQFRPATLDEQKVFMKNQIRKEGTRWGLTAALSNLAVSVIIFAAAVIIGNISYEAERFYTGPIGSLIQQIAYSVLLFTVPYIIGAAVSKQKVCRIISFRWKKPARSLPLIMMGLGAAMVINLLVGKFMQLLQNFGLQLESPDMELPSTLWGAALYVFTISVVPALVEEFAFRGVIMGSMKKYGNGYAIIASGLLFGLMHGNLVQIPFAAALGCVLGYVAVVTDSIWPAVLIHFLNNFFSAVSSVFDDRGSELASTLFLYGGFALYLIMGIVGFIIIKKLYKNPFAPIREKAVLTVAESAKSALLSPGYIVAAIFFGGTVCLDILMNLIS